MFQDPLSTCINNSKFQYRIIMATVKEENNHEQDKEVKVTLEGVAKVVMMKFLIPQLLKTLKKINLSKTTLIKRDINNRSQNSVHARSLDNDPQLDLKIKWSIKLTNRTIKT